MLCSEKPKYVDIGPLTWVFIFNLKEVIRSVKAISRNYYGQ